MFNFISTDFRQVALAAVGALILSTTAVTAAVGPARAVETASVGAVQTDAAGARA